MELLQGIIAALQINDLISLLLPLLYALVP